MGITLYIYNDDNDEDKDDKDDDDTIDDIAHSEGDTTTVVVRGLIVQWPFCFRILAEMMYQHPTDRCTKL